MTEDPEAMDTSPAGPSTAGPSSAGPSTDTTDASPLPAPIIEEDLIQQRLRRPWDLVRILVGLLLIAAIETIAYFATGTTHGLEEDLGDVTRGLPDILILLLNIIGGMGLLTLPVAVAVDLLIRGRGRQLLDSMFSMFVAVALLTWASILISNYGSLQLILSLAGSTSSADSTLLPLLGGLMAFITTARLMARGPWATAAIVVVVSLFIVTLITGGITLVGITISLLAGWTVGLMTRYALGTLTTRPSGEKVAQALSAAGYPVKELHALETTEVGRRYTGIQVDGPDLEVVVLDRDLEGAGLAQAMWNSLRLRQETGRRSFNMRRSLEQRALMSYAARANDVPVSRLVAARDVGPDATLLAYEHSRGSTLSSLPPDEISDSTLESIWTVVRNMQHAALAHRRLTADNIYLTSTGEVQLLEIENGTIAAGDVLLRIDLAEVLCNLALLVGPERATRTGVSVLGPDHLSRALPVLQPVALSKPTKQALSKDKKILGKLRDELIALRPDAEVEKIELERIKPRTIIMVVLGSVAAYFLFAQLAEVDLANLLANVNYWWVAVAFVAALMTYPGAAWSLTGFVPEKLRLLPTMAAQLAGDFATLVAPPTLGAVAINLRYLQKSGVHPALATASIGVAQVAAFMVHVLLLLSFGVAAGTQTDFSFNPPKWVVLAVVGVLIVGGGMLLLGPVRRLLWKRIGPLLKQVGPRMATVAQTPSKILEGVGGMFLLNLGYIITLTASVEAFGGHLNFVTIAVVYLTGSVIGQAAPTPGGLGAVEAAMAAGLTAAGLDAGVALSSVLLYRVITFWLPTVPGWFAFNWLQKNEYL